LDYPKELPADAGTAVMAATASARASVIFVNIVILLVAKAEATSAGYDFKTMLDDILEQRDRWQQQAERVAALAITDQRKEPAPAQPQSWRRWLRTPTGDLLFLWFVGLMCGGVLLVTVKGGS
jgi:hypothetical protein